MKANKAISVLSFILVVVLSGISFVLSYFAIRQMTIDTGATVNTLAFLMPFVVDGAMMVFSFSALRKSLSGDSNRGDMALVIAATVASICFNVLHAPREVLSMVIAGLPPLALFFSFERVIDMVRDSVRRNQAIKSLADVLAEQASAKELVDMLAIEASSLQASVNELTTRRKQLVSQCQELETKRQELDKERQALETILSSKGKEVFTDEQLLGFFRVAPKATHSEAARAMGVTRTAVSTRLASLVEAGVIHKNGKVEIL